MGYARLLTRNKTHNGSLLATIESTEAESITPLSWLERGVVAIEKDGTVSFIPYFENNFERTWTIVDVSKHEALKFQGK